MQLRDNFGFQCRLCPHVVELQLYCCWYVSTEQMDIVDVKMVGVSLCQPPPLSVIHLKKDRIFRVSVFIYHNFQEALPRSKEVNPFCSKLCKTVKSGGLRCLQRSSTLIFHATISSATATFLTHHITFDHITAETWHWENGQLYTTSSTWSWLWWNSIMMLISETTGWCEFILLWGGEVLTRPSGRTG